MKILIVEDNFVARKILGNFLQQHGVVDIASDGKEAVEAVQISLGKQAPYDLICLDILMPGMDGNETLESIRQTEENTTPYFHTKVIMTSSLEDSASILKAFSKQCDGYLKKPITKNKIEQEMAKLELI